MAGVSILRVSIPSSYVFQKQFLEYSYHGDPMKADGEYWARKGAGRVSSTISTQYLHYIYNI